MTEACIGLGGNVGEVLTTFRRAVRAARGFCEPIAVSAAYRTAAVTLDAAAAAPDYWNAVLVAHCTLRPHVLLARLLALETRFGRVRRERWGPRTLDLDLLLCGDTVTDEPALTLPHPGLRQRLFVLRPLCDVRPDLPLPQSSLTPRRLLESFADPDAGILARHSDWL